MRWVLLASGPVFWLLAVSLPAAWIEEVYARRLGLWIAQALGLVFGPLPFSACEWLIPASILGLGFYLLRALRRAPSRWKWLRDTIIPALAALSAFGAFSLLLWGFDYRRAPLATSLGWDTAGPGLDELRALMDEVVEEVNRRREAVAEDAEGVALPRRDRRAILAHAPEIYRRAAAALPFLAGEYSPPKPLLSSVPFSWAGVSGIYIPYTAEPNVNVDGPAFGLPFTACHELAHQRGFAREDEANFLAWYLSREHGDADFAYSGAFEAVFYVWGQLRKVAPEDARRAYERLGPGPRRDLDAWRAWRKKREWQTVQAVSHGVNDVYLQANGVQDGVESYGRVVDLMIAERRRRPAP